MTIITLLTDFGTQDGYPGIMKGVILGIAPAVQIVDLTHEIAPQNVLEGMLALRRAVSFFPEGTVHLAVVDPGVGTQRRPIAARMGPHFFVGPDNGLFSAVQAWAEGQGWPVRCVHLDRPQYWLPAVSSVFHGRDIFAPAAAHLATGIPLEELGTVIHDPVQMQLPEPERSAVGWRGQVLHIDHFGNLATNLRREQIGSVRTVRIHGVEIPGVVRAFGDGQPGELVALIDSDGWLSVCLVNGSAKDRLKAQVGDAVEVS